MYGALDNKRWNADAMAARNRGGRGPASLTDVAYIEDFMGEDDWKYGQWGPIGLKERLEEGKISPEEYAAKTKEWQSEEMHSGRLNQLSGDVGAYFGKKPDELLDVLGVENVGDLAKKYVGPDGIDLSQIASDPELVRHLSAQAGFDPSDADMKNLQGMDPKHMADLIQKGFVKSAKHHGTLGPFLSGSIKGNPKADIDGKIRYVSGGGGGGGGASFGYGGGQEGALANWDGKDLSPKGLEGTGYGGIEVAEPIDSSGDDPTFGMSEEELRKYHATQGMPEGMSAQEFKQYEDKIKGMSVDKLRGIYEMGRRY
jgi:hypothetical protein